RRGGAQHKTTAPGELTKARGRRILLVEGGYRRGSDFNLCQRLAGWRRFVIGKRKGSRKNDRRANG
ncbi:MAG: hypothetical protein KAI41_08725, partial [Hyphomicrobiaceae bacterium]|nr:hypothetical protein [Hyphomicrobiaceae bacterium]